MASALVSRLAIRLQCAGQVRSWIVTPSRALSAWNPTPSRLNSNALSLRKVNFVEPLMLAKQEEGVRHFGGAAPLNLDVIKQRVLLVLRLYDKINPEKLTVDSHFMKDLGLDSLDHVEVIMAIEDEFGFEIPDDQAEMLLTPAKLIQYVADHEDIYE